MTTHDPTPDPCRDDAVQWIMHALTPMLPDATTPTKTCSKCGLTLPLTSFYAGRICKLCRCAQTKAWKLSNVEAVKAASHAAYERDKAAIRERHKCWSLDHPGKATEYARKWSERHPEKRREVTRRYRDLHDDRVHEYGKAYYGQHRDEMLAANAEWRARHPLERRAASSNRRARVRNAPGSHTAADIAAQRTRQKGRCYWCGKKVGRLYHVDHVVPLALGGSNGAENLVIACAVCNLSKGARHPMDWDGRLL